MAGSMTVFARNAVLDGTGMPTLYLQQHTGAPGATGVSNVSTDVASGTRPEIEFDAAASGATDNTNEETGAVTVTETFSHWSLWDAATAGNCWWTGDWNTARDYTNGDSWRIAAGDLDLTLT